jgi:hypothetical protein
MLTMHAPASNTESERLEEEEEEEEEEEDGEAGTSQQRNTICTSNQAQSSQNIPLAKPGFEDISTAQMQANEQSTARIKK